MSDNMNRAKQICGYEFEDGLHHLRDALHAAGAHPAISQGNQGLAIVGNQALALFVTDQAVQMGLSKGEVTSRLQAVANNSRLAAICQSTRLSECIVTNPGQFGPLGNKTLSATVHAVVGAAYKTGGMEAVEAVLQGLGIV